MKKNIITLVIIILPLLSISQSKISVETSIGNLEIGKDRGENVELGINYHFSEKTAIKLSGLGGKLENRPTEIDYQVLKFSLYGEQKILTVKNIELGALLGVSYIDIEENIPLGKNQFTGFDLGLNMFFNPNRNWGLGLKLVNTYAYDAQGGIRQANIFIKYNF